MKLQKKQWTIAKLNGYRNKISLSSNFNHRRSLLWMEKQRQLLIDSIIRGYDIPKLYLHIESRSPIRYEVVIGKHLLDAILSFMQGELKLPNRTQAIDGHPVANFTYEDLPKELKQQFDAYPLDIVVIDDAEDDEIWEMMYRLRYGTTRRAQEIRDAQAGPLRDFVKDLARHRMFARYAAFSNLHLAHEHVAAQITLMELEGGITGIDDPQLDEMYRNQQWFDLTGRIPENTNRILNYMTAVCSKTNYHLRRPLFISFYALIAHLLENYDISQKTDEIASWLESFESPNNDIEKNATYISFTDALENPAFKSYQESTITNVDSYGSVKYRHEYMLKNLAERIPVIKIF